MWLNSSGTAVNTLTYNYDPNGNLLSESDSHGTLSMAYDPLNWVSSTKDIWNLTLTYGYDANSNRTTVQDSLGGRTTSVYNAVNLVTSRQFSDGTTPVLFDLAYTATNLVGTITRYSDLAGTTKVGESDYSYSARAEKVSGPNAIKIRRRT